MKEYKHAVMIGRYQPFHNGHQLLLQKALEIADKVLILIGSSNSSNNIKNPFTFDERVEMIKSTIPGEYRVEYIPIRDYYNNDTFWVTEVQNKVSQYIENDARTCLIGNFKDASSYYLKLFPQWEFVPVKAPQMDATTIRELLYSRTNENRPSKDFNPYQPNSTFNELPTVQYEKATSMLPDKIANWLNVNYCTKAKYHKHVSEYNYIQTYKAQWENSPFPPIFVTTDCVVMASGHVLVIERGLNPGKGLLALPGGFLKQNERLEDGAIRELREETGIDVNKLILKSSIVDSHVFDYPERSLRGRTITHGYCIKLIDGKLPRLATGDDANRAFWISLSEVAAREKEFFEDHYHIVNYFAKRN